jgi:hypothetical protein
LHVAVLAAQPLQLVRIHGMLAPGRTPVYRERLELEFSGHAGYSYQQSRLTVACVRPSTA